MANPCAKQRYPSRCSCALRTPLFVFLLCAMRSLPEQQQACDRQSKAPGTTTPGASHASGSDAGENSRGCHEGFSLVSEHGYYFLLVEGFRAMWASVASPAARDCQVSVDATALISVRTWTCLLSIGRSRSGGTGFDDCIRNTAPVQTEPELNRVFSFDSPRRSPGRYVAILLTALTEHPFPIFSFAQQRRGARSLF